MRFLSFFASFNKKRSAIGLSLLCVVLVTSSLFFNVPLLNKLISSLDAFIYDELLIKAPQKYKELARVVIVDIDDTSLAQEGRWPWPRDKLADLFLKLQQSGVVVVGVDIIMSAPETNYASGLIEKLNTDLPELKEKPYLSEMLQKIAPEVDNDLELARAMKSYDVSLGFLFHDLSYVRTGSLPPPLTDKQGKLLNPKEFNARIFDGYNASLPLFINASGHGGFVTNIPDADGVIRHGLTLGSMDNKVYPSLALQTVMRFLLAPDVNLKINNSLFGKKLYGIDVGGTFIPTNASGQILIPFWGGPYTLPYISATDVLHNKIDPTALQGAIAIVGSSALLLEDLHESPVDKLFPGVEMVGNMVSAMLSQQISTFFDWKSPEGFLILLSCGSIFAVLIAFLTISYLIVATITVNVIALVCSVLFFHYSNHYASASPLLVLFTLEALVNYSYDFYLETKQKFKIRQLFGQYIPDSYVNQLLNAPESSTMEGQTKEMTVLFSDIRNFTDTSESLDAGEIKRLLNTFFTPFTQIIFEHEGTIDKYVGDMIVAFWGAPLPLDKSRHPYLAVCSALRMQQKLPEVNQKLNQMGLPDVHFGVGIGTGLMNVGDMGSEFRRAYTVLGDTVNLTSRVESLTKYYHANILATETTRENQDAFLWRMVDKIKVKGRKTALTIYEPLGLINEVSAESIAETQAYTDALNHYFAKDWSIACQSFEALRKQCPNTYIYQLYYERICIYKKNPPPNDWDGVYEHMHK